jgi:membrane-associated protease RseP (regulator of RpoE activity)
MQSWIQKMIVLLSFFLVIFIHELGHFAVMNQYGVEVESISVGIPFSFVPMLRFSVPRYPKLSIELSPILIGGQAKPTNAGEKLMKALPFEQRVHIYAAGVKVNLFVAFLTLGLSAFVARRPCTKLRRIGVVIPIVIMLCTVASFFVGFYELALIPLTCLIVSSFLLFKKTKMVMGLVRWLIEFREALSDIKEVPIRFAALNIFLFVFNLIPLSPMDGGHIIGIALSLISERCEYLFLKITWLIALGLMSLYWVFTCKRNV